MKKNLHKDVITHLKADIRYALSTAAKNYKISDEYFAEITREVLDDILAGKFEPFCSKGCCRWAPKRDENDKIVSPY